MCRSTSSSTSTLIRGANGTTLSIADEDTVAADDARGRPPTFIDSGTTGPRRVSGDELGVEVVKPSERTLRARLSGVVEANVTRRGRG